LDKEVMLDSQSAADVAPLFKADEREVQYTCTSDTLTLTLPNGGGGSETLVFRRGSQ
jgi:hypothetical protein